MSSPNMVWSRAPTGNAYYRILKATERSFLHLYADAFSSSVFCATFGGIVEV